MKLVVERHPALRLGAFTTRFEAGAQSPDWLAALLDAGADAPVERSEEIRTAVRDLLRHGGYKPTGRGKPASEYLVRAAREGALQPINLAVDACNVVSLHSGLPISVIDLDRATLPLHVGLGAGGARYVFNASGQEIKVEGLVCLHDADGPCANAVKDSQRTKTGATTTRTLSLVWGARDLAGQLERATAWYRGLLERAGATTEEVVPSPGS